MNSKILPVVVVDEEAEGGPRVIARCKTIKQAEDLIDAFSLIDPDKVYRGGFGIDAPENLINP